MKHFINVGLLLSFALACAPSDSLPTGGGGAVAGTGGSAQGSGGMAAGSGGSGGGNLSSGGTTGSGGSPAATGGSGTGGSQSGGSGTGGTNVASGGESGSGVGSRGGTSTGTGGATGGQGARPGSAGGSAGAGTAGSGGGAGSVQAVPSAGCGKSGRPANGVVTVANDHIYNFPTTYDGQKPMPLVIALHGANSPNTSLQGQTNGSRLDTNFIRAFPKSAGSAWVIGTDGPRLTTIISDLFQNYCVDTSRVFATGHSSGAQMVVQMLCVSGGEKRFKAVAPVAASRYCAKVSPIPVMYIQGMMDMMRGDGNGIDVVNVFASSNMCGAASSPYGGVAACNSTLDRQPVTSGCVTYQSCVQPTVWCSHNDNGYNATDGNMHGWPCFASNAMADFFLNLP